MSLDFIHFLFPGWINNLFWRFWRSMSYLFLFWQQDDTLRKMSSFNTFWQKNFFFCSNVLERRWIIQQLCVLSEANPALWSLFWRQGPQNNGLLGCDSMQHHKNKSDSKVVLKPGKRRLTRQWSAAPDWWSQLEAKRSGGTAADCQSFTPPGIHKSGCTTDVD